MFGKVTRYCYLRVIIKIDFGRHAQTLRILHDALNNIPRNEHNCLPVRGYDFDSEDEYFV